MYLLDWQPIGPPTTRELQEVPGSRKERGQEFIEQMSERGEEEKGRLEIIGDMDFTPPFLDLRYRFHL